MERASSTEGSWARRPAPVGASTLVGLGVGLLAGLWFAAALRAPAAVESLYSRGAYPLIAGGLARLSAPIPFSIGEPLAVLLLFWVLGGAVVGWRRGRRRGWSGAWSLIAALLRTMARLGVTWALFLACWGMNYARLQPESLFDIDPVIDPRQAEQLIERIGQRIDELRVSLPQDDGGVALMPSDLSALDRELEQLQAGVLEGIGLPEVRGGRVKRFVASPLLHRWGVSGVYSPLTGEPQLVVPVSPTQLPFVLAHERAHLAGFAWEEAASFVALLTCWRSTDPAVRYSAWLALWMTLREDVGQRDPGVKRDLLAIQAFVKAHRGREAPALWKAYSGFLSAHGVKGGSRSYGRVGALALGWLSKNDLPAE